MSEHIQNAFWVIPTVQTVHIVSIAIVMTSVAMLDLRLVGIAGRRQSLSAMGDRFLPWVWVALLVLLCSGSLLIIGALVPILVDGRAAAVIVLHRSKNFWEHHRAVAVLLGSVSLVIWVGIIAAGRWIAYVAHG